MVEKGSSKIDDAEEGKKYFVLQTTFEIYEDFGAIVYLWAWCLKIRN